jgi:hypothetical protein
VELNSLAVSLNPTPYMEISLKTTSRIFLGCIPVYILIGWWQRQRFIDFYIEAKYWVLNGFTFGVYIALYLTFLVITYGLLHYFGRKTIKVLLKVHLVTTIPSLLIILLNLTAEPQNFLTKDYLYFGLFLALSVGQLLFAANLLYGILFKANSAKV